MHIPRTRSSLFVFIACCMAAILAACGTAPGGSGNGGLGGGTTTATPSSQNSTPSPANQTVPMPPTQTACPADGTARAAVMKPLALGSHQNLVYIYNEVPPNTSISYGHLKRYDVTTGQKSDIVTSGLAITEAEVSFDGQWVLFLSQIDPRGDPQHSEMLQLVRMDGQGLQTLYCFPAGSLTTFSDDNTVRFPIDVQWSSDQKSILMTMDTHDTTSSIRLLDVASGAVHTEIAIADSHYRYSVLTWLDNTRAYIAKTDRSASLPPTTISILNTATNHVVDGSDLTPVLTKQPTLLSSLSMDSSFDGSRLFVGYCVKNSHPFDSSIWSEPATGGAQQTIAHQASTSCLNTLRVISNNTLLLIVENAANGSDINHQIWTMQTDGSAQKTLATYPYGPSQLDDYSFNRFTQFTWSNVSRDGSMYGLKADNLGLGTQRILIGSLNGGTPTEIASTASGGVDLVGWTTM